MTEIVYEPHPVTAERKAELRSMGVRVIDARFNPQAKAKNSTLKEPDGIGTDSGDQFSDEQLRDAIEKATGKPAHPAMKRENLIAKYNKLNSEQN